MTNTDYINFKPMLVKIAKKYINNKYYELEDLISIGTMGLIKAFNTYDENRHTHSFVTHCWKNIEYEILKELCRLSKKHKDYTLVSIEAPTGDGIYISDMLEDDINVIEKVSDRVFITFATNEFYKTLQDPLAVDIIKHYVFDDNSIEYLAKIFSTDYSEMKYRIRQYRDKLRRNMQFIKLHSNMIDTRLKNISEISLAAERIAIEKVALEQLQLELLEMGI